ncbi:MAG: hypothetical protein KBA60_09750 [Flavobacteriales bacterium]|nr:hypothetical protein [Flavobacteriales bacterium]MBP7156280.1 hypothetical protein [Flavobacteriales bacterium]
MLAGGWSTTTTPRPFAMLFTLGSEKNCGQFIQWTLDRIPRDRSCCKVVSERASGKPVGMIGLLLSAQSLL